MELNVLRSRNPRQACYSGVSRDVGICINRFSASSIYVINLLIQVEYNFISIFYLFIIIKGKNICPFYHKIYFDTILLKIIY